MVPYVTLTARMAMLVLALFAGKHVPKVTVMVESSALNLVLMEEESDMSSGMKISATMRTLKAANKMVYYGILGVEMGTLLQDVVSVVLLLGVLQVCLIPVLHATNNPMEGLLGLFQMYVLLANN
jgi:hypothetical protein